MGNHKIYKSSRCNDRKGFKQLEVNKKTGLWTFDMESYDMDNKVRSFVCFDYDA
jgi:hypothetical protein